MKRPDGLFVRLLQISIGALLCLILPGYLYFVWGTAMLDSVRSAPAGIKQLAVVLFALYTIVLCGMFANGVELILSGLKGGKR